MGSYMQYFLKNLSFAWFVLFFACFSNAYGSWLDYEVFDYDNIFEAIEAEKVGNIERLLSKGVNLEERNKYEDPPLYHAIKKCVADEVIAFLLEQGADFEARDSQGNTALLLASSSSFDWRLSDWTKLARKTYQINVLCSLGADIDVQNNIGNTPLMQAVSFGNKEILSLLIEKGADLEKTNNNGMGALALSAELNKTQSADALIRYGANISARDQIGMTPLMYASYKGNTGIIKLLIEAGASVHDQLFFPAMIVISECRNFLTLEKERIIFPEGATALTFAEVLNNKAAETLLLNAGAIKNEEIRNKVKKTGGRGLFF